MPNTVDNYQNQSYSLALQANAGVVRLFNAQNMGASLVSAVLDMGALNSYPDLSLEFATTGTLTGTFTWESSNSYDPGSNPGATFFTVADASTTPSLAAAAPAGAVKTYLGSVIRVGIPSGRYLRLRWAYTSGAGNCDAWVYLRGVAR